MMTNVRDSSIDDVSDISSRILTYLSAKPGAEDTVEGIVSYLLFRQQLAVGQSQNSIDAAIEQLLQQGAVEVRQQDDGRLLIKLLSSESPGD
jgi:hypothetical protein